VDQLLQLGDPGFVAQNRPPGNLGQGGARVIDLNDVIDLHYDPPWELLQAKRGLERFPTNGLKNRREPAPHNKPVRANS
jgi:hypothetical protein